MNPYIIGPYKEDDAFRFKGRTSEIDGMFRSFIQNDYLVCYADSGEGKSSILNAGLFPKLRENRYFPISVRFNFYDSDVQNMNFDRVVNAAINASIAESGPDYALNPTALIFETYEDSIVKWQEEMIAGTVWLRLRYSELSRTENGKVVKMTPVLVFDQFEEVFTNPESQIWTSEFFRWLEELSTDVCPMRILNEVSKVEEDIPLVASLKRFKAIFSLRSEYVGNVDYWGLQHYYIPDLKNNRYFLKPLTARGAEEVICQDGGLNFLSEIELRSLISGCAANDDYVKAGLPCIPASILSVICHEIYDYTDRERKSTLSALNKDRSQAVEKVLDNYYNKILARCGVVDDRYRDAFENALVDDKGNRKRIGVRNQELSTLSREQIDCLVKEHMLRVVSRSEIGDGDVVELPHDRFCLIIKNHKNKRFQEIQERNRSLKEWMHFGVLCACLGILALLMHFDFIEMLRPIINDMMTGNYADLKDSIINFINRKSVSSDYYPGLMSLVSILLIALVLPLEFLGTAKQWKIFTSVVSIVGISVSGWFVRIGEILDFSAGTTIFMSLLISLGIITYTSVKWSKIVKSDVSAWPLWGSWFLFFLYLYWEFVRCLIIGINEPWDSWEFVMLLPILLLSWTWCFFKAEIRSEGVMSGKWWFIVQVLLLLFCLLCLAYNARIPYWEANKYSLLATMLLLALIMTSVVFLLMNIPSVYRRTWATILNLVTILAIYVFNLGYNPLKIEYDSVYRVTNWRAVYMKDSTTGLYGICNAMTGDTIIPFVIDTFDVYGAKVIVKSNQFKDNPIHGGGSSNADGSFIWRGLSGVESLFISGATLEEYIVEVERDSEASLECLSARLYKELRNLSMDYVYRGKPYLLVDVSSLEELDSLQCRLLDDTLYDLLNADDTLMTRYGPRYRKKLEVLTDADLYEFYAVATRNLFLHILKDRISCADYSSVITLLRQYPYLYFTSVPLMTMQMNYQSNVQLNEQLLLSDYRVTLYSEEVLEHKCYVWYKLFINLCLQDYNANVDNIYERMGVIDPYRELFDELKALMKESPEIKDAYGLVDKSLSEDVSEMVESIVKIFNYRKKLKDILRQFVDMDLSVAYTEVSNLDQAFDDFSDKLIDAMLQVLEKNTYGMYNSAFEDICKSLMIVRLIRGYEISSELERMKEIDRMDAIILDSFTSLLDNIQVMPEIIRELSKEILKEL